VTITWKIGDGPRFATDVVKCSGYTKTSRKCSNLEITDDFFNQRVSIAENSPSLVINSVRKTVKLMKMCWVCILQG